MNTVSVFNFRDDLATYIDTVVNTEIPLVIEKRGKPVAILSPYKGEGKTDYNKYFGFLGGKESGEEFLKRVRRNDRELKRINNLRSR
jgi:prevent-host-death family protein